MVRSRQIGCGRLQDGYNTNNLLDHKDIVARTQTENYNILPTTEFRTPSQQ
jgi:hypothetical protein